MDVAYPFSPVAFILEGSAHWTWTSGGAGFLCGDGRSRWPLRQGRELRVSLSSEEHPLPFLTALTALTSGFLEVRVLSEGAHFIVFFLLLIHRHSYCGNRCPLVLWNYPASISEIVSLPVPPFLSSQMYAGPDHCFLLCVLHLGEFFRSFFQFTVPHFAVFSLLLDKSVKFLILVTVFPFLEMFGLF